MPHLGMRAVVIVAHGGVDGLQVREVDRPAGPVGDRVLVRVRAAALNRADILQRKGYYPAPAGVPSDIPGLEFAGEVEQVGKEVRSWRAGQRVFGIAGGGSQAEYILCPENSLVEIPANLDWAQAAAVPEAFITAHDALFTQAGLKMGESLLVHAAGSGVGIAGVQLARATGATVYGTSRSADKLERAAPFGLSKYIVVGDSPLIIVDALGEWTSGAGVNVILDLVGAPYLAANLEVLAAKGRLMVVGTTAGSKATIDYGIVMRKRLQIKGTMLRSRGDVEKALATRLFADHVVPLLTREVVRPVVDRTYSIDEVREAHQYLESNASFGKVVLMI